MKYLETLRLDELTSLVRVLRRNPRAEVTSWTSDRLSSGQSGTPVFRVQGQGRQDDGAFNWSLILKYSTNIGQWDRVYDVDDPSWRLEMLLYQSGLLDGIPGGLRPPRLIAASEQAPTEIALWLEDVGEHWAEKWSVERYAEAAFHLGQFNAYYADRPPSEPWLAKGQWRAYIEGECNKCVGHLAKHQDHPEVLAVYPKPVQQRLFALNDASDQFITRAYALAPVTLCHGDAGGRNIYDYEEQTVAIDWFCASIAPLGEEVARMVGSSIHWFFRGRMQLAGQLSESVLSRYIDGLRDGGWNGDPDGVRFTFKAALATMYGLSYVGRAHDIVTEGRIKAYAEGPYQTTEAELLEHLAAMARFFLQQGDEAQTLADQY